MSTDQQHIPHHHIPSEQHADTRPARKRSAARRAAAKAKDNFLNGGGWFFQFLRSIVSSQVASWIDLGSSIGLVALHVSTWVATPIGAILGGIVNCCINYKFTFKAKGTSPRAVAVKYLMVWLGSLILNTVGTSLLANVLDSWNLLEQLGFTNVGSYAAARLVVSLLVSWFWNFLMQKNFVYRPVPFDAHVDHFFSRMARRQ